jgi:adenylate cyclase
MALSTSQPDLAPERANWLVRRFRRFARHRPFFTMFLLVVVSNAAGSYFNFAYNAYLVVPYLTHEQREVFWKVASPLYNLVAYPTCLGLMIYLLWPLMQCWPRLLQRREVDAKFLEYCRGRVINLPFYQVLVNSLGWIPGAFFFPWIICFLGGNQGARSIWTQFAVSFLVSALLTTVQTFFLLETYLMAVLYPVFFQDARPAQVRGAIRVPYRLRLIMLWFAVAVMPLVALLSVALNIGGGSQNIQQLVRVALGVFAVGLASGLLIFYLVGRDLLHWVHAHAQATELVEKGDFEARVAGVRPDEWGQLTDRFNDMAGALQKAQKDRDTFGQFVGQEVRDEILAQDPGLGGTVRELTVLFVDIRGFSRRTAGVPPDQVFALTNSFLSLAVQTIVNQGGHVDKFLGDGLMALFGHTRQGQVDHADQAVLSSLNLLKELKKFNQDLARQQQSPLLIGIGIHTGPALVGCVGATWDLPSGSQQMRREYTAIGETVNLCQRIEQLTKKCGGPILLSQHTQKRLRTNFDLEHLGSHQVQGWEEGIVVYRVVEP